MREIYETAQRVVMWVGEEADDSHVIFEHINKWTTYRDDYNAGRTTENDPWNEAHINMPTYIGDTRTALEAFCRRPYFSRTWVIQEVAVSKQVLVICGRDQAELDLLLMGASFKRANSYDPFAGIEPVTHFHELRQISRPCKLPSILRYSRYCSATDPRDKVFGLLGLFHKPLIAVDYASDVETVFRDFTEAVLQYEQNLEFLHWFGVSERQIHGLPSWVPDYTASKPIGVLPRVHGGSHILTAASRSLDRVLPGMQIDGNRLRIKGSHLDTVMHVSVVLFPDPENHPDSDAFRDIMRNWEETAAKVFRHKRGRKPIADMFMKTLTAGKKANMLWYSRFGSGALRNLDNDYFNDYHVLRAWRTEADINNAHEETYLSHFKSTLKECCYGRKIFVTEKGTMGLAPPSTQEGDFIVFFSGGTYPFVLRPLEDETFAMLGDCYLCDPERDSDHGDDFDPHTFYENDIYRDVTEWVIR